MSKYVARVVQTMQKYGIMEFADLHTEPGQTPNYTVGDPNQHYANRVTPMPWDSWLR